MIPTSWLTAILFLLFVAPGLAFDLLSARRRTHGRESAFREVGRIVLASTWFSGIAIITILAAQQYQPTWFIEPEAFAAGDPTLLNDRIPLLIRTILTELAIAFTLALGVHALLAAKDGGTTITSRSGWTQLFKTSKPRKRSAYVRAQLTNGTVYYGRVVGFTTSHELADREITLTKPLFVKEPGQDQESLPEDYTYVHLKAASLEVLTVEYRDTSQDKPGPMKRPLTIRMLPRPRRTSPSSSPD